jgi:hypothetical protein
MIRDLCLGRSDPDDKVLLEGEDEKQGDYIFTANTVGEYSFCFENEASMTDKTIDFEFVPSPSLFLHAAKADATSSFSCLACFGR